LGRIAFFCLIIGCIDGAERNSLTPRVSPYQIVLSPEEERALRHRAASYTLPYYVVCRAEMILYAAQQWSNDQIGQYLHMRREIVSKWRKRFCEQRLAGLEERQRPGRPRAFPPGGRHPSQGHRL
jgi:hypothetical protein